MKQIARLQWKLPRNCIKFHLKLRKKNRKPECMHLLTLLWVTISPWTVPFMFQAHLVHAWCVWLPWISRSVCAIRWPCWRTARRQWKRSILMHAEAFNVHRLQFKTSSAQLSSELALIPVEKLLNLWSRNWNWNIAFSSRCFGIRRELTARSPY